MEQKFRIIRNIRKLIHPPYGEIVELHRVVNQRSQLDENRVMEVTPDFLEQTILKYQADGYQLFSLDDVQLQLKNRKCTSPKFVCFTLDDGYADNYDLAYPVFKRMNCPFAIYVTTDYPDQKAQFWWYQLEDALFKNERLSINHIEYDCSDFEKKNRTFWEIRESVYSSQAEITLSALGQIFQENDCGVKVHALSWGQLIELAQDPLCTIGAHTVSHASLPALSDENIQKELSDGKKRIEDRINKPVNHFSYPFGNYDARVMGFVKELYSTATTTKDGFVQKGENIYALKRKILFQL